MIDHLKLEARWIDRVLREAAAARPRNIRRATDAAPPTSTQALPNARFASAIRSAGAAVARRPDSVGLENARVVVRAPVDER